MLHIHHTRAAPALLIAALLTLSGACSDVPSAPRQSGYALHGGPAAADRDASEMISVRTRVTADGLPAVAHDFPATAHRGVATLEGRRFRAEDDGAVSPIPLRVVDVERMPPAFMRTPRVDFQLSDGRKAVLTRELSADGLPLVLSVRVGNDEWRWQRTWEAKNGRVVLRQSVVETVRNGRVVTRAVINVSPRPVAMAAPSSRAPLSLDILKVYSARFGSIAVSVLLPRAAEAQTNAGKTCYSNAVALGNAWMTWRTAVVWWSINVVVGTPSSLAVATLGLLGASAAVDNAEASYIDCYVSAAKSGLSVDKIAVPPSEEQAY